MELVHPCCAALDVHKKNVTACRVAPGANKGRLHETRTFATTTRELLELRDWLQEGECTHVAIESTGVYWQPVYNVLEGSAELLLVNARHVKNVPGRKTDVQDAEWLAELLRHGLLRPSFVPPKAQRDLRELTRNRSILVVERAAVVNRIQKVLEGANIKLASVASDVVGASGRAMLEELIAGETSPEVLAKLARGRLKEKRIALEAALEGRVRPHHCFLLTQHLTHLDFLDEQIAHFDKRIEAHITSMDASPGEPPTSPPSAGETTDIPPSESRKAEDALATSSKRRSRLEPEAPLGYAEAVRLLDPIPGVAERVAQTILAEIGTDMRRFPTPAHLASWAGVCPGNYQSAGNRRCGKTTEGNLALRKALTQAAHGAKQTKGAYFGALYGRLAGRRGKRRAIVAVSHALLVVIYHILRYHEPYRELGRDYYDERRKEDLIDRLLKRIERLGYRVTAELKQVQQVA